MNQAPAPVGTNSPSETKTSLCSALQDRFLHAHEVRQAFSDAFIAFWERLRPESGADQDNRILELEGGPVAVGQIRQFIPQTGSPLLFLVADDTGDGFYLILPISSWSYPATDEELWMGLSLDTPVVGDVTLQLWAAATLHKDTIMMSIIAGSLSEELTDTARRRFRQSLVDTFWWHECDRHIGTPITDAEDPRLLYTLEELGRWGDVHFRDYVTMSKL